MTARRSGSAKPRPLLALVVAMVAIVVVALVWYLLRGPSPSPAEAAAERFLATYVDDDGRVVRIDEGGDTVSEGQSYALLAAVAVGDEDTFDRVWAWTAEHLQRDDGLLAWLWRDGEIVDPEGASDADVDTAHALLIAADQFDRPAYRDEALRMARMVLETETVQVDGRPVLVAGPWARDAGPIVNPSYFAPVAFGMLGDASRDDRWGVLADSGRALTEGLLADVALPPDWALLDGSRLRPATPPDDADGAVTYGLDAARLPVRFAASCNPADRRVAASLWPLLSRLGSDGLRLAHDLGGGTVVDRRHPMQLVGAAAAAHAAGDRQAAAELLDEAEDVDRRYPSYYGSAWVALGRLKLQSNVLGSCPQLSDEWPT